MKKLDKLRKEVCDFLQLEKTKKVTVISDNDEDGITCAAQAKLFFNKNGIEAKVIFYNHHSRMGGEAKKEFFEFGGEKTIFLDLADDFVNEALEDLGEIGDMLVLDHHNKRFLKDTDSLRIIKPDMYSKIEPSQYPASKITYDFFEGVGWLAAIGIIGDSARGTWDAFIKQAAKNYSLEMKELDKMSDIVSCIISQHKKMIPSLLEFLVEKKDPKRLLSSKFAKLNDKFQEMLKKEVERFDSEAEHHPQLKLSFFRTKYQFTSKLSNVISQKYPSRTIVILNHKDDKCNASLRNKNSSVAELRNREKLIDCSLLAKEATDDINGGKGGGHIPAAGASFPEEHVKEFKENVIELIKKSNSS